jgi:hypothetical protein
MISLVVNDQTRWRRFSPLDKSSRFHTGRNSLQKSSTLQNNSSKLSIEGFLRNELLLGNKSLLLLEPLFYPELTLNKNFHIYTSSRLSLQLAYVAGSDIPRLQSTAVICSGLCKTSRAFFKSS